MNPGAQCATRAPPRGRVAAAATARKAGAAPASLFFFIKAREVKRGEVYDFTG